MEVISIPDQTGISRNFTLKDTMLVKEYRTVIQTLRFLSDFASKVKTADPQELENVASQLNLVTVDQWDFMVNVVKRCYGLTDIEIDTIHNADMLFLFSELINESRTPKKKLSTQSSSESTIPTPLSS